MMILSKYWEKLVGTKIGLSKEGGNSGSTLSNTKRINSQIYKSFSNKITILSVEYLLTWSIKMAKYPQIL